MRAWNPNLSPSQAQGLCGAVRTVSFCEATRMPDPNRVSTARICPAKSRSHVAYLCATTYGTFRVPLLSSLAVRRRPEEHSVNSADDRELFCWTARVNGFRLPEP